MQKIEMPKDVQAMTVLVVDDDVEALEEMQDIVDLEGWNAIIADDVDMALEVLEWYPYIGVVVTDVHFRDPKGDMSNGIQLISRAKARYPDRGIKFILLSGDPDAAKSIEQLGAIEFLSKPLDADRLIAAIKPVEDEDAARFSGQPVSLDRLEVVQNTTQKLHDQRVMAKKVVQ